MFQRKNLWIIHVLAWLLFLVRPLTIMFGEVYPNNAFEVSRLLAAFPV